jgi:hypothetical protein
LARMKTILCATKRSKKQIAPSSATLVVDIKPLLDAEHGKQDL